MISVIFPEVLLFLRFYYSEVFEYKLSCYTIRHWIRIQSRNQIRLIT
jgi:hypothetical protein